METLLQPIGIGKGIIQHGFQTYIITCKDEKENIFVVGFTCLMNHTDSIEKALSRLAPITLPPKYNPEEITDASSSKEN